MGLSNPIGIDDENRADTSMGWQRLDQVRCRYLTSTMKSAESLAAERADRMVVLKMMRRLTMNSHEAAYRATFEPIPKSFEVLN